MSHEYKTKDTCSTQISFDKDENGVVTNIVFTGGCNGNLKALSKILDGWQADKIVEMLQGITCGRRPTSCSDQLAKALLKAK
ncbi:MAG: TIGR03905 family TSCPD domain-containing protein [Treponema sp.]|nr:TIGR03905 family TSCPD domain-containing protein [Treponema sp.]